MGIAAIENSETGRVSSNTATASNKHRAGFSARAMELVASLGTVTSERVLSFKNERELRDLGIARPTDGRQLSCDVATMHAVLNSRP